MCRGTPATSPPPAVEDAQQHQSLVQVGLIGQGNEIVTDLMQDRFTNGEFRFELKDAMRQCDHRARDGTRLGRDRQTIPPEPASESVPLTRVRAASVDKSQYSHSGSQRASSSRTSAVNDMQAYAFVLARDRSRWEMLT